MTPANPDPPTILPCACGGEALLTKDTGGYWVQCARVPFNAVFGICWVGPYYRTTPEEAIQHWNALMGRKPS